MTQEKCFRPSTLSGREEVGFVMESSCRLLTGVAYTTRCKPLAGPGSIRKENLGLANADI